MTSPAELAPREPGLQLIPVPGAISWDALAAPIPDALLQFRPDGKPFVTRGRSGPTDACRYVVYIDAQAVRERLDAVVPGQWRSHLHLLPTLGVDGDGVAEANERVSFICRLTICGVEREDVGSGSNYKAAASDAFKRAAQRFGVGASLHRLPTIVVPVELRDGNPPRVKCATVPPLKIYRRERDRLERAS